MHTAGELIECKTVLSGNKKLTLDGPYLKAFLKEAAMQDRRPVLSVELYGLRLVVLTEDDYTELRDQSGEH